MSVSIVFFHFSHICDPCYNAFTHLLLYISECSQKHSGIHAVGNKHSCLCPLKKTCCGKYSPVGMGFDFHLLTGQSVSLLLFHG